MAEVSTIKLIDLGMRGLLYAKFKDILDLQNINLGVIFNPKEIALRDISEKKEHVALEFINLWKSAVSYDWERARTAAARHGFGMRYTSEAKVGITNVKAIAVKMSYDVWWWTKDREKLNQIIERYLFWLHTDPRLHLQYEDIYPLEFLMHFDSLEDESTLAEKYNMGVMHVVKATIKLDGQIFVSSTSKTIKKIILTIYDSDELTAPQYTEIVSGENEELAGNLKLFTKTIEF